MNKQNVNDVRYFIDRIKNLNGKSIILYHAVHFNQERNLIELLKSIIQNGLIPYDPHNGDEFSERGSVIWFSTNYKHYAEKSKFVLSIEYNEDNIKKFDLRLDYGGEYATATQQIPFEYLTVMKIPVIKTVANINSNVDLIKLINEHNYSSDKLIKVINDYKYKLFINFFEKYVQPYINDPNYTSKLKENVDKELMIVVK